MTSTAIPDALDALKTIVFAVDPTPYDKALSAFAYPKEYADINVADPDLPMIIVGKDRAGGTIIKYTWGKSLHRWIAIVEILFCPSARMNDDLAAEQEKMSWGWVEGIDNALKDTANTNLSGTVDGIGHSQEGEPDVQMSYDYGELGVFKRDFYGLHIEIPVFQII